MNAVLFRHGDAVTLSQGVSTVTNPPSDTSKLLASLGVAAGALATTSAAQAAVVVTDVNTTVGYTVSGPTSGYVFQANGNPTFAISPFPGLGTNRFVAFQGSSSFAASNYLKIKAKNAFAAAAAPGTKWAGVTSFTRVASGAYVIGQDIANGRMLNPLATGELYYDVIFNDGGTSAYGWVSLTEFDNGPSDFGVHIDQFAYDTTGAQIAAGNTGAPAAVPEPASLGLLAIGALVSGAAGTRRFKRARVH
jgi:hypothetical protein